MSVGKQLRRVPWWAFGVVVLILCVLGITRTFVRQSRGPIKGDFVAAQRKVPEGAAPNSKLVAGNAVIEPAQPETKVATDVAGRIDMISVVEGDHVTKGTPILSLENAMQRAELAAAEAELAAAEAELARTTAGMRPQDVSAYMSDASSARARSDLAKGEYQRAEDLAKSGSISKAEVDNLQRKWEAERAQFYAASARASGARAGGRREDIAISDARARAARARREFAKASLDRFIVTAPVDGEVLRIKGRVGEYYNPQQGEPVLIIGDTRKLRARVDVDERDVARVKLDAPAFVLAGAFGDKKFSGKVVEIGHRMGRRVVRVDDPIDRVDVKILEVVIELDERPPLVPGLRTLAYIQSS